MEKKLNEIVSDYKKSLEKNEVQEAYEELLKYLMRVKTHLEKSLSGQYRFGNISPGYLDFSYFPFFNDYLRKEKLRFGIVLNHKKMRFEIWLMGQNSEIQKNYWEILKNTKWNKQQIEMPKYSVLENVIVDNPDFNNLDSLTAEIEKETIRISNEIVEYLKK